MIKVVIDTNVVFSGLMSKKGASFVLLDLIDKGRFKAVISVPLVLEYEETLKRKSRELGLSFQDIDDALNYICSVAEAREIFFLWRPYLNDPSDDMVLELAVESSSKYIITFNIKDFKGVEDFGIKAITPKDLLQIVGEIK